MKVWVVFKIYEDGCENIDSIWGRADEAADRVYEIEERRESHLPVRAFYDRYEVWGKR